MWIILDLIVVAVVVICIFVSAHRGFVRTVIETVGFVAALFIAFTFSGPAANFTYDKIIEPPVIAAISDGATSTADNTVETVWEALPDFLTGNAEHLGLSKDSISASITQNAAEDISVAASVTSQSVVRPVVVKLLGLLYTAIISVVLLFVVKILARLLNKVFSFSVVGKLNRFLGGLLGLVKGLVFAVLFCMLATLIVSFTANGFLIFTADTIEATYIFKPLSQIFI